MPAWMYVHHVCTEHRMSHPLKMQFPVVMSYDVDAGTNLDPLENKQVFSTPLCSSYYQNRQ